MYISTHLKQKPTRTIPPGLQGTWQSLHAVYKSWLEQAGYGNSLKKILLHHSYLALGHAMNDVLTSPFLILLHKGG